MKHNVNLKIFFIFIVIGLVLFSCSKGPSYPEAPRAGQEVKIAVADLKEQVPSFYAFEHEGKSLRFFVVKINGAVEAYLDACRTCAPYKKGFFVQDGELVCRACGQRYPLDDLKGIGGCYPIILPVEQSGEFIYISTRELIDRMKYF